jgi:hypothetical protein
MPATTFDPAMLQRLRPILDPNERLVWVGHPDSDRAAMEHQELVLCGLIMTALGAFGIFGMGVNPSTVILFGPFALFGVALLWARGLRLCDASHTLYALTGERLIILDSQTVRKVQSFAPGDLGAVECVEEANGFGDLLIVCRGYRNGLDAAPDRTIRLSGIPGVREVEGLLQSTFQKSEG